MGLWLCVAALGGCRMLMGSLDVEGIATAAQKPSNVGMYLAVTQGDEPTTDLTAADFTISEDGVPLDSRTTQQALLDRNQVAVHRTLLLVDVSALTDEASRQALSRAVAGFVASVRRTQPVAVYVFDGRPTIELLGDYPVGAETSEIPEEISALASTAARDPSRDLNGALIHAVDKLGGLLAASDKPVRIGSLAFFTWGPDLAGRVPEKDVLYALEAGGFHVFGIGVQNETAPDLGRYADSGVSMAETPNAIGIAFDATASKVSRKANQYYLLSYCSPARAGMRRLRVEVKTTTREGDELTGKWEADFDSSGFGPGCNPMDTPRFPIRPSAKDAAAPAAGEGVSSAAGASGAHPVEPAAADSAPADATQPAQAAPRPPAVGPADGSGTTQDKVVPPPAAEGYAPVD